MKFVNFIQGQKHNLGVLNSSGKIVSFTDLGIETNDMNESILINLNTSLQTWILK